MAQDLSAVGNAASAPKAKTGLSGDEVFDNSLSLTKADNGGFSMSVNYKRAKKGDKRDQSYSEYCPPKTEVFPDIDSALDRARMLFGGSADAAPDGDTDTGSGAPPAPTGSGY